MGGANRTIIKLAQQLLVHPDVKLGDKPVGALATLDQVYDLVSGNIPTELRQKIQSTTREVDHPLAESVAKAVCLLQFVQNIPATRENLAATLHPFVDGESRLADVEAALHALVSAHKVREGERGYRIPSPAEDDWEARRAQIVARPGDELRLQQKTLDDLWTPQPSHLFMNTKAFKAGLAFGGRVLQEGDLEVHVNLADPSRVGEEIEQARARSHTESGTVFWVAEADEDLAREFQELHRSEEMLVRGEHRTPSRDEATLVADEKRRREKAQKEVRRRLMEAVLTGSVFFRGNDRSPSEDARDLKTEVEGILQKVLPDVFDRFGDAAAKVKSKDLEVLLTAESLHGLPNVFSDLGLVITQRGQDAFNTESGPLVEILARITNRAEYGDPTSGKALAEWFGKEPYGWDFDVIRLMAASLLRAGKIEFRSQNQTIESADTLEAKSVLTNNNRFRQATLRPKSGGVDPAELADASSHFESIFGRAVTELTTGVIARDLREEMGPVSERLGRMVACLETEGLVGHDPLEAAKNVASELQLGTDEQAVKAFNTGHKALEHGLDRLRQLEEHLHDAALEQLRAARHATEVQRLALKADGHLDPSMLETVASIQDVLAKETFYRELPTLASATVQIQGRIRSSVCGSRCRARVHLPTGLGKACGNAGVDRAGRGCPGQDRRAAASQG